MNEIDTNMYPESVIVRDRLKGRRTGIVHREKVKDHSASASQVDADPVRYYPQWFNPDRDSGALPQGWGRERFESLRSDLRRVHGGLGLVWHPVRCVLQVYLVNENIQTWWTKGWERLFMIEPWGDNTSLSTRIKAKLYLARPELFGAARTSAERVLYEKELDERRFHDELDEGARDNARDIYWRGQIRSNAKGSQFSNMYE